ncbi:MAG: MFS transporter [Peptococcales bacterium]
MSIKKTIIDNWPLYFCVLFVQIGLGVVGPVLKDIQSYFALESVAKAGLVISSFGFARLICDLPSSFFVERLKPERIVVLATILVVVGSLSVAMASNFNFLLLGRVVAGGGSALSIVSASVLLNKNAHFQNRGSILGTYQAFFLVGTAIGPIFGGFTASVFSWRGAFFVSGFSAFLALLCSLVLVQRSTRRKMVPEKVDNNNTESLQISPKGTLWMNVIVANFMTFILFFAFEGFNSMIIPLYGSEVLGLEPRSVGIILSIIAITRFLVSFGGGVLSDKYGRGAIIIPCLLLCGLGMVCLQYAQTYYSFLFIAVIFAFGRMGNNLNVALIGDFTPKEKMTLMIGVNRFLADIGYTIGPIFLGMVVDKTGFNGVGITVGIIAWLAAIIAWRVIGLGMLTRGCNNITS